MVFPHAVEQLKSEYTDKYVKVDASRPELARFGDAVGQVKTVNMNGRALVQFLNYHTNVGWYDIDLGCLTVVEKPSEDLTAKPEAKRAHDTPAGKAAPTAGDKQVADAAGVGTTRLAGGEKKLSPLELARMQGAAGTKPAAAAAPGAKPAGGGKPSTADILAAARGKAGAPAAAATSPPKAETPAPPAPAPAAKPAAASGGGVVKVDRASMTVQQMIDYCRAKDTK